MTNYSKANNDEPNPPRSRATMTNDDDQRESPSTAFCFPTPAFSGSGTRRGTPTQPAAQAAVVTRSSAARRVRTMTTIIPD
jgi:hypothetical protein